MRIAYVAPYQGAALLRARPIVRNLSLGGRAKIELFAEMFAASGHDVEILSQGEVVETQPRYFPALREQAPGGGAVPVRYASAVPLRFVSGWWSSRALRGLLGARHRQRPFDLVLIYNLKPPQVACAKWALERGVPVVLEYEDDHFGGTGPGGRSWSAGHYVAEARHLMHQLSGCIANSADLLRQSPPTAPQLLLAGVVGDSIERAVARDAPRHNRIVFSGTHARAQGLEPLVQGWLQAAIPGWELHIAGHGDVTPRLHALAAGQPSVVFHGIIDREANAQLLTSGRMTVVPFDIRQTRGFSFKTTECLAAGLHVVTTRLSALDGFDPALLRGITFVDDAAPATIAACIRRVIDERRYESTVATEALSRYGMKAVSATLSRFLDEVVDSHGRRRRAAAGHDRSDQTTASPAAHTRPRPTTSLR